MADLIGGHVQVGFDVMVTALPQVRSCKLRALAVAARDLTVAGRPDRRRHRAGIRGERLGRGWRPEGTPTRSSSGSTARLMPAWRTQIKARLADAGHHADGLTAAEFGKPILPPRPRSGTRLSGRRTSSRSDPASADIPYRPFGERRQSPLLALFCRANRAERCRFFGVDRPTYAQCEFFAF